MAALTAGVVAPDFTLKSLEGRDYSLGELLRTGPVVLAFFKVSCPVCQYAFPYIERLFRATREMNAAVIGISQNDRTATTQFTREFGITFPVLMDAPGSYPVSNAYGLTIVPTTFLISQGGEVERSIVGWDRGDMEELSHKLAESFGKTAPALFHAGEDVAAFKAG